MGIHLFPFRTEKLSPITPMVLRNSGRVGSRRIVSARSTRRKGAGQEDDRYLYAVEANYATGTSPAGFSNVLGKGVGNEASLEAAASMSVTPNPNRGQFSLEVPFEGEWKVFDLKGRLVMKRHLSEGTHSMDVDLEAGNYLMVLDSGTVQVVGKLVIL